MRRATAESFIEDVMRLLHVGVVVHSISDALDQHREIWAVTRVDGPYHDPSQCVNVAFAHSEGPVSIELIEPAGQPSPVDNFLKRGGGLAHLCFEVDDLDHQIAQARQAGAVIASAPKPAAAFGGRRIAFVRTPGRMLIEYVEAGPPTNAQTGNARSSKGQDGQADPPGKGAEGSSNGS